jgi:hypothetical protein
MKAAWMVETWTPTVLPLTITDARLKVVDFTKPYSGDSSGFAVDRNGPLAKLPMGLGHELALDLRAGADLAAELDLVAVQRAVRLGEVAGLAG